MAAKKLTSNIYFNPKYKDEENAQKIQFKWELEEVKYDIYTKRLTKLEFTPFMRHCAQVPYYIGQAIGRDGSEENEKKIETSCMQVFPRTLSQAFISAWIESNGKTFKTKIENFINKFYKPSTSFNLIEEIRSNKLPPFQDVSQFNILMEEANEWISLLPGTTPKLDESALKHAIYVAMPEWWQRSFDRSSYDLARISKATVLAYFIKQQNMAKKNPQNTDKNKGNDSSNDKYYA